MIRVLLQLAVCAFFCGCVRVFNGAPRVFEYYLVRHPEACRANVSGSKVTYLDFWETYEQALRERGITTQEAAARALKTALANHREGRLLSQRQLCYNIKQN